MTSERSPDGPTAMLRLYPAAWRRRYGPEMAGLLAERPLTMADRLDLLRGAADAHLHPATPSRLPAIAALLAGAVWVVVGLTILAQPLPPDWPSFLAQIIPLAWIGSVVTLLAALGIWARIGDGMPALARVVALLLVLGHVAWAIGLALAFQGIEYGLTTAITQTAAAAGIVALALALSRTEDWWIALLLLVAGTALLVPHVASWLVVGLAWTGIGLVRAAQHLRRRPQRAAGGGIAPWDQEHLPRPPARLVILIAVEIMVLWLLVALVPSVSQEQPNPPWGLFGAIAIVLAAITLVGTGTADRTRPAVDEPSVADALEALGADPTNRTARFELVVALMTVDIDAALEEVGVLLDANAVDVDALALRAVIRRHQGDIAEAMADFDLALRLTNDPDRIEMFLDLRQGVIGA